MLGIETLKGVFLEDLLLSLLSNSFGHSGVEKPGEDGVHSDIVFSGFSSKFFDVAE